MIKKVRNLLRKLNPIKKEKQWSKGEDGSHSIDVEMELYLQDEVGLHLVYIHGVKITNKGIVVIDYTSSTDLEKRGLMKHLNDAVLKTFFKEKDGVDESA